MQPGPKRPVSDINVTPLVDVVLVLLIIFMVLTPLTEKQMFLSVPEFEPPDQIVPPSAVPPDQTVLTVLRSGRVLLNRQEMSVSEAMQRLRAAYQDRLSKVLFFNAEDEASYQLAVAVLDEAHRAGVATIGMMTDPALVPAAPGAEAPPSAPAR